LKFVNKNNGLPLFIEEDLLIKLGQIGIKHFPNEFGGFLIGQYSDDLSAVIVKNYLLPRTYKGFPTSFVWYIDGLVTTFKNLFQEQKQYYIGEWHTHPNGSTAFSQTDLTAMIKTVECDTVNIKNPILLILSVNKTNVQDYTFYFYDNKRLIPYEK
jgi:proteasome lid subunit RPN8/RPN11